MDLGVDFLSMDFLKGLPEFFRYKSTKALKYAKGSLRASLRLCAFVAKKLLIVILLFGLFRLLKIQHHSINAIP
jgi:hypothetical protein